MMNAPRIGIVYDRVDEPIAWNLSQRLSIRGIEVEPISSTSLPRQVANYQWYIFVRTPNAVRSGTLDNWVNFVLGQFDTGQIQGVLAAATTPLASEDISPPWSTIRTYNVGTSEQDWQSALDKIEKTLSYSRPLNAQTMQTAGLRIGAHTFPKSLTIPIILGAVVIVFILSTFVFLFYQTPATTKHGKPTPIAHASPAINLTATNTTEIQQYQKLYNDSVKGKLVLSLPSTAADQTSLWETSDQCMFQGGNYIAKASVDSPLQLCMSSKPSFDQNFAYQATLSISAGGYAGGLVFGSSGDTTKQPYYRFAFLQGQAYKLVLANQPDTDGIVKSFTTTQLTPITLTVIVSKGTIYLYIDKNYVYQTPDTLGAKFDQVGVYAAWQTGAETDVTFTDVKAWTLK